MHQDLRRLDVRMDVLGHWLKQARRQHRPDDSKKGDEMTMDFDVTALEMLPAEEEEGLMFCWLTCLFHTCGITCDVTD